MCLRILMQGQCFLGAVHLAIEQDFPKNDIRDDSSGMDACIADLKAGIIPKHCSTQTCKWIGSNAFGEMLVPWQCNIPYGLGWHQIHQPILRVRSLILDVNLSPTYMSHA